MSDAAPGPWCVVEGEIWDTRFDGEPGIPLFRQDRNYRRWGRDLKPGEHEASTLLAASAPDLLTALEPFARLQMPARCEGNTAFYSLLHTEILAARTAIARATGETP